MRVAQGRTIAPFMLHTIRALTLDLDDTLWPVWPTIERAEAVLIDWLRAHAPATAQRHDTASLRRVRDQVGRENPDWVHDLTRIRRESIRRALSQCGDDPALAEPAFEAFFAERQNVRLFDDVRPALARLAARYPIVALTNGNADLARIGLAEFFQGSLSAREFGLGKPHMAIFRAAAARTGQPLTQVLHVGDDPHLDVEGAVFAGMPAAWVRRPELPAPAAKPAVPATLEVPHLLALAERLGC